MTITKLTSLAFLVAATFTAATAFAQQPPAAPAAGAGGPPSAGGPPQGGGPAGSEGKNAPEGPTWPVVMVTSVEVLRSEKSGGMDILRARGLVTSGAWDAPHLIPITQGKPIDDVLDVLFVASAPTVSEAPGDLMQVEAILPLGHGHPYKAVRVRSDTNAVAVKEIPGFAEVKVPRHDCGKCIGRYFVAKGANPPAGVAADNIVKEENLPWNLRVIKPTDGIAAYQVNPNRLTLVLGEDGRIVDAAWD
ncbi:hypothetical protein [Reyranella sp.]|uniref:hypothetical protein n=1 Tax=Reyranella sp. TaxID=1929291 RepID=UPI003D10A1AE